MKIYQPMADEELFAKELIKSAKGIQTMQSMVTITNCIKKYEGGKQKVKLEFIFYIIQLK